METSLPETQAADVADLTFKLLSSCQKKEERIAKQFGLTVTEFRILRAFRTSKIRQVKDVIDESGVGGSSFSKIAASLEAKGFLIRAIEPQDRRSVRVSLTPKGATLSQRLESRYIDIHKEILKDIPAELHQPIVHALEQLFGSLDRWLHEDT